METPIAPEAESSCCPITAPHSETDVSTVRVPNEVMLQAGHVEYAINALLKQFHAETGWFINEVMIPGFRAGDDRVDVRIWPVRE